MERVYIIFGKTMPIVVDEDKCTGCGKCVDTCHRRVYELQEKDGRKVAVPTRAAWCLQCFLCVDPCPTGAIEIQLSKKKDEEEISSQ